VVEAAVPAAEAVWAMVEEAEAAPVTVVEEAEPWSGAYRHGAKEAHSLWAPLVEAPGGAGTHARAQCSVQVVAGPRVSREEASELRVAWRGTLGAPGPRVVRMRVSFLLFDLLTPLVLLPSWSVMVLVF
jgi:hypothetical protein